MDSPVMQLYKRIFGVGVETDADAAKTIELNCLRKTYLKAGMVYGEDCNGNRWKLEKKK